MAKVDEAVSMGTPFTMTMWSPVLGGEQGLREESSDSVSPAPTFVQDLQELIVDQTLIERNPCAFAPRQGGTQASKVAAPSYRARRSLILLGVAPERMDL